MQHGKGTGGGRGAGRGRGGPKDGPSGDGNNPSWKKPQGSVMSAKAKKEYLQWKRNQKREQKDDGDEDAAGDGLQHQQQHQHPQASQQRQQPRRAAGAASPPRRLSEEEEEEDVEEQAGAAQGQGQQQQQRGAGAGGAARHPLQEPSAPLPASSGPPIDAPLRYVAMCELPAGDVPDSVRALGVDVMRMPRIDEAEVGFSEEGRGLGMPKRPAWRGKVSSGEELHALEEAAFERWAQALQEREYGPRVSFFEPRLEFWRQLWRVLERSDVAVMICDARNPLLHFSEALVHHALRERRMSALLVLNKADLVPEAAGREWREFFQARYPGLSVVLACAQRDGAGGDAAQRIMDALLSCRVTRGGRTVTVGEVVGLPRDTILQQSRLRNTHKKRDAPRAAAPPVTAATAGGAGAAAAPAPAPAGAAHRGQRQRRDEEEEEEDDGEDYVGGGSSDGGGSGDWQLKGTKAKKKQAVRRKRNQRMHGGGGAAHDEDDDADGASASGRQQQQQQHGHQPAGGGAAAPKAAAGQDAGGRHGKPGRRPGAAAGGDGEGGEGGGEEQVQQYVQARGGRPRVGRGDGRPMRGRAAAGEGGAGEAASSGLEEEEEAEDEEDEGQDGAGADADADADSANDNAAFDDLEGDLGPDEQEEHGREAHGEAATAGDDGHESAASRGRAMERPVVACVVGEPNVGKSSTMNALLGAHRVAVSSHPGRTKHYQTHFMVARLMLCDCPGLVFPRLDVSLPMQILFGSYPIARCRDPYSVVRYLAERVWPRLHVTLGLKPVVDKERERDQGGQAKPADEWGDEDWTPLALCEALASKHNWRSRRGGRLDTYRAANWILRSALAGRNGVSMAFLPPQGWRERRCG